MHLFGTILTPQAVASNNRGELEGGTTATLQKVIRNGDLFTTVSGESIRYSLRESWVGSGENVCRDVTKPPKEAWHETGKLFKDPEKYLDNDVLGYMHAKEDTKTRRGILEVSRAISTQPWPGTISHNFASAGSGPEGKVNPKPYACEIHDTRYQYTFAMTPGGLLADKYNRTERTLRALQNLRRVGGCHARFLYDFSPEAVVLRWSTDPAPRIMFCFDQDDRGRLSLATLLHRIRGGDVEAKEVFVGTAIAGISEMGELKAAGVNVFDGVKRAVDAVLAQVRTGLGG